MWTQTSVFQPSFCNSACSYTIRSQKPLKSSKPPHPREYYEPDEITTGKLYKQEVHLHIKGVSNSCATTDEQLAGQ